MEVGAKALLSWISKIYSEMIQICTGLKVIIGDFSLYTLNWRTGLQPCAGFSSCKLVMVVVLTGKRRNLRLNWTSLTQNSVNITLSSVFEEKTVIFMKKRKILKPLHNSKILVEIIQPNLVSQRNTDIWNPILEITISLYVFFG